MDIVRQDKENYGGRELSVLQQEKTNAKRRTHKVSLLTAHANHRPDIKTTTADWENH